jgi:type II secretion system protein G
MFCSWPVRHYLNWRLNHAPWHRAFSVMTEKSPAVRSPMPRNAPTGRSNNCFTFMPHKKSGFTLIELMIVVAIIGILAAVAVPKYVSMTNKSKEGATKGCLAAIRSALSIYYGDNEQNFPSDNLACLTIMEKYMPALPPASVPPNHDASNNVFTQVVPTDVGSWSYNNNPATLGWGQLVVGCTHSDISGNVWTSY